MTPSTSDSPSPGNESWAQTVVDGVSDGESETTDSPNGPPAEGSATVDDGNPASSIDEAASGEASATNGSDDGGSPTEDGADDGPATDQSELDQSELDQPELDEQGAHVSVEALVDDLERVSAERDQYLDASRRLQAEFENYKKQVAKREADARERANDKLINELLPVLDAFDGAVANGAEDVAPMRATFIDALAKQGLERIDPADAAFDPTVHEAVLHEDGDGGDDGPVVAEVMRAGYVWNGRVLRPAMVKTRG